MQTTLKNVADKCGVSKSLVSRILNKDETVRCSLEKKELVIKTAESMQYCPNIHAQLLATKTVKSSNEKYNIGCISYESLHFKGHPYFNRIIEGIEKEIKLSGCNSVLNIDISTAYKCYRNHENLYEKPLDGIILLGEIEDAKLFQYITMQAKFIVSISSQIEDSVIDFVGCDLNDTLMLMINQIKQYGYEEMGLIYGVKDSRQRQTIFKIKEIGMNISENFLLEGKFDTESTYNLMCETLKNHVPPKVICCFNDEMAIGCIRALTENNYKVPQDVSVTGHDDIIRATYFDVPLSTVKIYKEEIGRLAVTILNERITGKRKYGIKVIIPGKLIIRKSLIKNKKEKSE